MSVALHHVGIQVADIARSSEFYLKALEGQFLVPPTWTRAGESVMGGPPKSSFAFCIIALGAGAIELFQFDEDAPTWARDRLPGRVPHIALHVDDVSDALGAVEAAGGRRLWPVPQRIGTFEVIYVADLDDNTLELISASLTEVAQTLNGMSTRPKA